MLAFKLHHLQIRGKHYLLLPKLNSGQMGLLARGLENKGFSVHLSSVLSASAAWGSVWISPSGFAWSSVDPEDIVTPMIPELLTCPKEMTPLRDLEALYFGVRKWNGHRFAKLLARVESGGLWGSMRAAGECGLTPDERAVALSLIRGQAQCRLVTDFLEDGAKPLVCGRKRYFETNLDVEVAASTLRSAGDLGGRNSYLPKECELSLHGGINHTELAETLSRLDQWCFLSPW